MHSNPYRRPPLDSFHFRNTCTFAVMHRSPYKLDTTDYNTFFRSCVHAAMHSDPFRPQPGDYTLLSDTVVLDAFQDGSNATFVFDAAAYNGYYMPWFDSALSLIELTQADIDADLLNSIADTKSTSTPASASGKKPAAVPFECTTDGSTQSRQMSGTSKHQTANASTASTKASKDDIVHVDAAKGSDNPISATKEDKLLIEPVRDTIIPTGAIKEAVVPSQAARDSVVLNKAAPDAIISADAAKEDSVPAKVAGDNIIPTKDPKDSIVPIGANFNSYGTKSNSNSLTDAVDKEAQYGLQGYHGIESDDSADYIGPVFESTPLLSRAAFNPKRLSKTSLVGAHEPNLEPKLAFARNAEAMRGAADATKDVHILQPGVPSSPSLQKRLSAKLSSARVSGLKLVMYPTSVQE